MTKQNLAKLLVTSGSSTMMRVQKQISRNFNEDERVVAATTLSVFIGLMLDELNITEEEFAEMVAVERDKLERQGVLN